MGLLWNWNGVEIDSPIVEKSPEGTGKEATEFELCRHSPDWHENQHGESVLVFQLFEPASSEWLTESHKHIKEVFEKGYDTEKNNETPLGAFVGSVESGMRFDDDKVTAFDVCLSPPKTSTTEQAKWWVLDRMASDGVLTPTVAYSHDRSFWHIDREGQVNIRAEQCELNGVALAKWLLSLWQDYQHEHVRKSRHRKQTTVSGR